MPKKTINIGSDRNNEYNTDSYYSRKKNENSLKKVTIPSWCHRVHIFHLYNRTIIKLLPEAYKKGRGVPDFNSQKITIPKNNNIKKMLTYMIGTNKKDYKLIKHTNKNKQDFIHISIRYEANILRKTASCVSSCPSGGISYTSPVYVGCDC